MSAGAANVFDRLQAISPIPFIKGLGRNAHISIDASLLPDLLRQIKAFEADPLFTLATHDETAEHQAFVRAHKSVIAYLDLTNDAKRRAELRAMFPDADVISLIYDTAACATVRRDFAVGMLATPTADVHTRYFILCPPRSGSYYLCDLLTSAGAGMPTEHIRPQHCFLAQHAAFSAEDFLVAMMRYGARDGVFGTKFIYTFFRQLFKLDPQRVETFQGAASQLRDLGFRAVRLKRADKVRQAVSKYVADYTREYTRRTDAAGQKELPPYDFKAIRACMDVLEKEENEIDLFLSYFGEAVSIQYEDLDTDPGAEVARILTHLGLSASVAKVQSTLVKQRGTATEDYVAQYQRDCSVVASG